MGRSCSCLHKAQAEHTPSKHKYESIPQNGTDTHNNYQLRPPSPLLIDTPSFNHFTRNNPKSISSAVNDRIQYTLCGITNPNIKVAVHKKRTNKKHQYHRLNTWSSSQFYLSSNNDSPITPTQSFNDGHNPYTEHSDCELELHRIITIGYITHATEANQLSIPLNIVELCRQYYFALKPIRRKRVIFTSVVSLNLCIDTIPKFILDESVFFFRLNTHQLFALFNQPKMCNNSLEHSENWSTDISETDNTSIIGDLKLHPLFIHYLKEKYENNLLLILDNHTNWTQVSKQLQSISDIWYAQNANYAPLRLSHSFWTAMDTCTHKFDATNAEILSEISNGLLKYAPSMEILWQSNPTLIPMKLFDLSQYHLQNGFNQKYIAQHTGTKSRRTITKNHSFSQFRSPSLTDPNMVVLSMYNSGNDFSEFSKASEYGIDQSYTAPNDCEQSMDFDIDAFDTEMNGIDFAVMNCNKLFDIQSGAQMLANGHCAKPAVSPQSVCNVCDYET